MRPCVRSATLDGYVGLARSLGLDPVGLLDRRRARPSPTSPLPDKWIPAADVATAAGALGRPSPGTRTSACGSPACRRLSTLGPLSVVLSQEPDLRSALRCCAGYEHSYNEALRLRLEEAGDLATIRLWFEFAEPAPTRQALELATAALLGHHPGAAGPAVGAAVGVLLPPGAGVARRPPRGVRAAAAVRARVHRAGLLRRPSSTPPNTVSDPLLRPYAAAVPRSRCRRPPAATVTDQVTRARRDAAAPRPLLDRPGRPQPRRDAADAAPPAGRGGAVVLGDRRTTPGRRWPSATSRPTATR